MLVQLAVGSVSSPLVATIDATVSLLPVLYYFAFIICIVLFYTNAIIGIVITTYQGIQEQFSERNVHVRARYSAPRHCPC